MGIPRRNPPSLSVFTHGKVAGKHRSEYIYTVNIFRPVKFCLKQVIFSVEGKERPRALLFLPPFPGPRACTPDSVPPAAPGPSGSSPTIVPFRERPQTTVCRPVDPKKSLSDLRRGTGPYIGRTDRQNRRIPHACCRNPLSKHETFRPAFSVLLFSLRRDRDRPGNRPRLKPIPPPYRTTRSFQGTLRYRPIRKPPDGHACTNPALGIAGNSSRSDEDTGVGYRRSAPSGSVTASRNSGTPISAASQ